MLIRILFWWVTDVKHIHTYLTYIRSKGTEMVEADESYNMLSICSWEVFPGMIY